MSLLCDVFNLDPGRAAPIYYDPNVFELSRKWALTVDGRMVSILTTTGLTFGWGRCIGIAGVATDHEHRGRGLAHKLIEHVLDVAKTEGEGPAMLFAHRTSLYKELGFELKDEVIRGRIVATGANQPLDALSSENIKFQYDAWAAKSVNRLVRTPDRWSYWNMSCRVCEPFLGGYACVEPGVVREAVVDSPMGKWPVGVGCGFYGLRSVAKSIG
ncbi:MAG: GNAT family N-acetyltransferase, partial [Chthonomonadaceae bacterium]|nr:GNAT family N-acetyltransferase [Chthonomonadaceae bacterium]